MATDDPQLPTNDQQIGPKTGVKTGPKIGLALGSGAARGWSHIGVLRALREIGLRPDVITGCSAGALVGGAYLLGVLKDFEEWAQSLSAIGAARKFAVNFSHGGMVDPSAAFDAFRYADQNIEDLPIPFGATATDVGSGQSVWITTGSVLDAARASSAIPMVIQAAAQDHEYGRRWLIDGAASDPVPVALARSLGAEKVIAVDLNALSRTIERFNAPKTKAVVVRPSTNEVQNSRLPQSVSKLIGDTREFVDTKLARVKAENRSKPHFFETAIATMDIVQMQLAELHARIDQPEVRIHPNMKGLPPIAFHKSEEFIAVGYEATMGQKDKILALMNEDAVDASV